MSHTASTVVLDPGNLEQWTSLPFETTLTMSREETEGPQLEALVRRFEALRPHISALETLATRQGVDRIEQLEDVAPLLFEHRVYKSYPMSIVEKRQFDRLTGWLDRLTTHDLSGVPMDDVKSVDAWIDRLDSHGMIMLHSTGTTGKLSFLPRSQTEFPAWKPAFFEGTKATTGVDRRTEVLATFFPGYRSGNATSAKMQRIFIGEESAGGEANRHVLYDYAISSDLLSLAARLRKAEEQGELDKLNLDPILLEQRAQLIEQGRRRDQDLDAWFMKLVNEFRGQKVEINGVAADLLRLVLNAREQGIKCEFAPGSVLFTAGGLKGFKDPPANYEEILTDFFGIDRVSSVYGMSECMGLAPLCTHNYYHFFPYTIPFLLDPDGNVLPREGVQTGRCAVFDLIAETYWGGFISGDRITMHWDEDCECGWKGPRLGRTIERFSELEGGDDKISCAGTEEAYNEFMEYVSNI